MVPRPTSRCATPGTRHAPQGRRREQDRMPRETFAWARQTSSSRTAEPLPGALRGRAYTGPPAMAPSDFVHLHVHSEYSILDGACRIPDLVARAAEFEMSAVSLTDHGS